MATVRCSRGSRVRLAHGLAHTKEIPTSPGRPLQSFHRLSAAAPAAMGTSPVAGGEDPTEWKEFKEGWHDYFKPVGVPEEEIVDFLAITSWRRRRIIRREVALMDARYEAMEEGAQSNTLSHRWTMGERALDSVGCDVDTGTELLQILDTLDANTKLDPEAAKSAVGVLFFCGPLDFRELPERREESSTATAGSFREWISLQAAAEEMTYLEVLQSTLQGGERILAERARRREAAEKCRLARERAAPQ